MDSGVFSIALEACASPSPAAGPRGTPRTVDVREYLGSDDNRLVQVAADSLLRHETSASPIVFYGPCGTGKTLLAHGLARRWQARWPGMTVSVTCGADFARSYAYAVDTDSIGDFRARASSPDLYVLDDVQQLQQKAAAQEEFTRLLDRLAARGAFALITACRPPWNVPGLAPALGSRLSGGLTVPLVAPGIAARRELVRRWMEQWGMELNDEAIELLAAGPRDRDPRSMTVPHLQHALTQLADWPRSGTDTSLINRHSVQLLWKELVEQHQPSFRIMVSKVAKYFSIPAQQLRGPSRRSQIVRARGVAMFLARELTGRTLQSIGRYFGDRDHTTVLHACRKTEHLRHTDPAIATALDELSEQLNVPHAPI